MSRLQGNVPVLVSGETWEDTAEELDDLLLGDAEIWWVVLQPSPNWACQQAVGPHSFANTTPEAKRAC